MKKLFILFGIILMSINLYGQSCYTVTSVENKTENPDLNSKRFTFGVKQITEELVSQKYSLCQEGAPIVVHIVSIEAPSIGINIGPFMIKKKITIVKTKLIIDSVVYEGEGEAKLAVKAGFAELRDENLPFEKSVFASAVKKSLENAISKVE
jgi:hypothetical protein